MVGRWTGRHFGHPLLHELHGCTQHLKAVPPQLRVSICTRRLPLGQSVSHVALESAPSIVLTPPGMASRQAQTARLAPTSSTLTARSRSTVVFQSHDLDKAWAQRFLTMQRTPLPAVRRASFTCSAQQAHSHASALLPPPPLPSHPALGSQTQSCSRRIHPYHPELRVPSSRGSALTGAGLLASDH